MKIKTHSLSTLLGSLALSSAMGILPGTLVTGQSIALFSVTFEPPTDEQLEDTGGGASRPAEQKCIQDASTPMAIAPLLPDNKRTGLTVASHPTFFAYIPPTSASQAYFIVKDANEAVVYQQTFAISETDGIASLSLPSNAPPLEPGQMYQWSLGILCQPAQTDFPLAEGRVKRVETDEIANVPLDLTRSLDGAALYGQSGLWYDTLTVLAELRRSKPNDAEFATVWENLLGGVGLEAIATKPFLNW